MHYLLSIDQYDNRELENELRCFFGNLHQLKHKLNEEAAALRLNRIQRRRCRENILNLEKLEQDFLALTYEGDIKPLYRKVQHYVKLDQKRLMDTFGHETVKHYSMFISL